MLFGTRFAQQEVSVNGTPFAHSGVNCVRTARLTHRVFRCGQEAPEASETSPPTSGTW